MLALAPSTLLKLPLETLDKLKRSHSKAKLCGVCQSQWSLKVRYKQSDELQNRKLLLYRSHSLKELWQPVSNYHFPEQFTGMLRKAKETPKHTEL